MISLAKYKVILWDFDGVLLDSMPIREFGFREVLKDFPEEQIETLISFHKLNGGMSRYVKFRYFYEQVLKKEITNEQVRALADRFSQIMLRELGNTKYLIDDSLNFIRTNGLQYHMHIVSGSDEAELRHLCSVLGIAGYFSSIYGSPKPKDQIIRDLLKEYNYAKNEVVLIGDSINDQDAANINEIDFLGYNNAEMAGKWQGYYINSLTKNGI